MLTCKHTTRLLSEALDRPLGRRERLALRLHLVFCRGCRAFRQHIDFLRRASRAFTRHDDGAP